MTASAPTRTRQTTAMTTAQALSTLLIQNPDRTVSVADVCDLLGRRVSKQAVSVAARRLAVRYGLPVEPVHGRVGGYRMVKG